MSTRIHLWQLEIACVVYIWAHNDENEFDIVFENKFRNKNIVFISKCEFCCINTQKLIAIHCFN